MPYSRSRNYLYTPREKSGIGVPSYRVHEAGRVFFNVNLFSDFTIIVDADITVIIVASQSQSFILYLLNIYADMINDTTILHIMSI